MSDVKKIGHPRNSSGSYEESLSLGADSVVAEPPAARRAAQGAARGRDVGSWDAYKNWLTRVQAPEQRRSLPDPALFSFKGYRSWAEKIRRDWDEED